jgi:4-amino-4-deoxy-L-arabinose transferase-like glycosyltransferase
MRARFLFRGADQWSDAFSGLLGSWTHADYPLLLPASIARGWSFVGSDTTAVPVLVAGLFTFAIAWLLLASLSSLRSRGQGLVAAAVVLGWHELVMQGTWQYADVPLAFFILASVVAIALAGTVTDGRDRFLVLAGIMAGLAAWTKNEGLLFLLAFFVAHFAVTAHRRGWRKSLGATGSMLLGLAPILALVVWFKWGIAPSNDLIASLDLSTTLGRLTDMSRYGTVLAGFAIRLSRLGGWLVSAPVALALYMLAVGVKLGERERPAVATAALAVGLTLAGYFFVFVITPHDLGWHVATSLHRLFLHAWPSLLFIFFLFARVPEEALTSPSVPQRARG